MTEPDLHARIERLEIRLMHQEAALEALTRSSLELERTLREQSQAIEQLESRLTALNPSPVSAADEETPPPHY